MTYNPTHISYTGINLYFPVAFTAIIRPILTSSNSESAFKGTNPLYDGSIGMLFDKTTEYIRVSNCIAYYIVVIGS